MAAFDGKLLLLYNVSKTVFVTFKCFVGSSDACECEKNDEVWRFDEGTITDDSRLPIKSLHFMDTDDSGEYGYFSLGPLICH